MVNNSVDPDADEGGTLNVLSGPENYLHAQTALQSVMAWDPEEFAAVSEYNASVRSTLLLAQTHFMGALVSVLAGMLVSGVTEDIKDIDDEQVRNWGAVIGMRVPGAGE